MARATGMSRDAGLDTGSGWSSSRARLVLSFDAAVSVQGDSEIWLDAEVCINRAEFGLTRNLMRLVSMNNTLTIHTVFTRR